MTETIVVPRDPERIARARMLNKQVIALRDELQERWFIFSSALMPIYQEKLYLDLGFRNWTGYINETLRLPVTTISNYLLPVRKLLQAGVNPEEVKDVPLNRVNDLAQIARANEGRLSPEILEEARSAKTRDEVQHYRETVDHEKHRLGIEPIREIKLIVTESLYDLWSDTTKLVAQLAEEPYAKHHDLLAFEMALIALQHTDEIQSIILGE